MRYRYKLCVGSHAANLHAASKWGANFWALGIIAPPTILSPLPPLPSSSSGLIPSRCCVEALIR